MRLGREWLGIAVSVAGVLLSDTCLESHPLAHCTTSPESICGHKPVAQDKINRYSHKSNVAYGEGPAVTRYNIVRGWPKTCCRRIVDVPIPCPHVSQDCLIMVLPCSTLYLRWHDQSSLNELLAISLLGIFVCYITMVDWL